MSDKKPISQDVLDLFDLVDVFWKERMTIVFLTLVALAFGGLFLYSSEKQYETSIAFKLDVIPPYLEPSEALADISQFFARPDLFLKWKKNNPESNFTFEMIDERQIIDGNLFAVDEADSFILIDQNQLLVRSNDIDLISDISNYLSFVSAKLTQIYFEQAKQSQTKMNSIPKETQLPLDYDGALTANMDRAKVSRFVFKVEQGLKILNVSRPNAPKRKNYRPKMTMALSLFFGLTAGSIFAIFRNAYRRHKFVRLAKAGNEVA